MENILRTCRLWRPLLACLRMTGVHRLLRRKLSDRILILCYHDVIADERPDVSILSPVIHVDAFAKQIAYLARNYSVISIDECVEALSGGRDLPSNPVVVTFDDAYANHFRHAFPVLKEHGIPATFYAATGYLDSNRLFWWDELEYMVMRSECESMEVVIGGSAEALNLRNKEEREQSLRRCADELFQTATLEQREAHLEAIRNATGVDARADTAFVEAKKSMTADMVREMKGSGMGFGSHTVNHPILTNEAAALQRGEVTESLSVVDSAMPAHFCYPNGSYDAETKRLVAEAGYVSALTCITGFARRGDDLLELPRIPADSDYLDFVFSVSGFQFALARLTGA